MIFGDLFVTNRRGLEPHDFALLLAHMMDTHHMMDMHHMMDTRHVMDTHLMMDMHHMMDISYIGQPSRSATFLREKMYDRSPSHLATHQSSETFSYQRELTPWLHQTSYLPH